MTEPTAAPSLAERILSAVAAIPAGRVLSYGDVAEYAGGRSARTVGQVLSRHGGSVPWHRVVHSDGTLVPRFAADQRRRLMADGVRFTRDRVDMATCRWDGHAR